MEQNAAFDEDVSQLPAIKAAHSSALSVRTAPSAPQLLIISNRLIAHYLYLSSVRLHSDNNCMYLQVQKQYGAIHGCRCCQPYQSCISVKEVANRCSPKGWRSATIPKLKPMFWVLPRAGSAVDPSVNDKVLKTEKRIGGRLYQSYCPLISGGDFELLFSSDFQMKGTAQRRLRTKAQGSSMSRKRSKIHKSMIPPPLEWLNTVFDDLIQWIIVFAFQVTTKGIYDRNIIVLESLTYRSFSDAANRKSINICLYLVTNIT